jgi:hypothetical protein
MNFFEGELVQEEGGLAFLSGDWRLPLPAGLATCWAGFRGRAVTLGLKAEDVQAGEAGPGTGGFFPSEMRAVFVEPMGRGVLVTLEVGEGDKCRLRVQGCQRAGERCKIREGDKVAVHSRLDRAHLFDRASGAALGACGPAG